MNVMALFDRVSLSEFGRVDALFLGSVLCIICIGIVMVSSASISISDGMYGHPFFFMGRQILYLVLGTTMGCILLSLPTSQLQKWGILMMGLSLILLILVLVPGIGKSVNGSRRWINLVVFNLQASEVAKVCMVVYLSGYLVRRADRVREG